MSILFVSFSDIWTAILSVLYTIFLMINSFIYDLINFSYQVFIALASAQIFTAEQYQNMAQKVYVVIGVVALFIVAYALLRAIADPDGAAKGDMAVGKIVPNLLKAIILIAFVPTIFNIAYNVQNVIIKNNVIPALIVGNSYNNSSSVSNINGGTFDLKSAGNNLANETFTQFLTPTSGDKSSVTLEEDCKIGTCIEKDDVAGISYEDMYKSVEDESKGYIVYANLGESAAKGNVDFNFPMQFAVGLFMVYVFVSFCIDMGLRVIKLAYYQIIAPIPILTLIIPGQKKIFDNWKNGSISTFAEVFVRLAVVMLGMVLVQSLPDPSNTSFWSGTMINPSTSVSAFARIFVIIGILLFIKQAPKLISDMFGIKSGSFKLGIGEKLGEMAFLGGVANKAQGAITGALGAGYTSKVNGDSFRKGAKYGLASGWKDGKGKPNQFGAQRQGLYSTLGYKGKAGAFGGQAFMDKWVDDTRNKYTDDYKDRVLSARINSAQDYHNSGSAIAPHFSKEYSNRVNTKQNEIQALEGQLDGAKSALSNINSHNVEKLEQGRVAFESQKQSRLTSLNDTLATQEKDFEANKSIQLSQLGNELNTLKSNLLRNGMSYDSLDKNEQVQKLQEQIGTVRSQQFDKSDITKQINDLSNLNFEQTSNYKTMKAQANAAERNFENQIENITSQINSKNAELTEKTETITKNVYDPDTKKLKKVTENVTKVEAESFKAAVKDLEDADETFKNQNKVFKARVNEKETNTWLNSEEGQRLTAALGKNINKVGGGAAAVDTKETKSDSDKK